MAKERPILFSAPMVRAILAGTKTQTRRIIKPSWSRCLDLDFDDDRERARIGCPYGARGDRLWVREAVSLLSCKGPGRDLATYDADGRTTPLDTWPWKRERQPGMFMPRGMSRITLEVTSVRVERLQDITEKDARAEGVEPAITYTKCYPSKLAADGEHRSYRDGFAKLWHAINGADSWQANPWVWVVEFRRLTP